MGNENKMRRNLINLLESLNLPSECDDHLGWMADHLIANDVVPVVRCKDCKWYSIAPIDNVTYCCHESGYCGEHMKGLFFCACGERKDNEREN